MFFPSSSWQALSYVLKQFRWCCVYKTSASNSFAIWMKSCDLCNGLECISDSWSNSKNKYVVYISYVIVHCSAPTSCGHILYFSLTMLWSFNQMNFWECVLNAGKHLWKTTCYFIFEHNKAALEVKILHSWDLLSINFSELIISRLLYCTFFCLTELIRHSFVGPGFQISFQAECALSLSWSVRSLSHNFLACVVWMSDAESLFTKNSWKSMFIIQCCCTVCVSVEPIYKQFIWLMDTSHDNYVNVIAQHHHHCILF